MDYSSCIIVILFNINYICICCFLATDIEVPGSIPGASRFSEKQWVWNGVHSASRGQLRSYLEEIVADPVKKPETNDRGMRCADHATPSIRKSWHYFANKRR
jgi:hypothetical protein